MLGRAEGTPAGSGQFGDALKATPCKAGPQAKEGLSPGARSAPFPNPWCGHLLAVQNPLEGAPSPDIPRQGPPGHKDALKVFRWMFWRVLLFFGVFFP